jgi:hypothetical protein
MYFEHAKLMARNCYSLLRPTKHTHDVVLYTKKAGKTLSMKAGLNFSEEQDTFTSDL